MDRDAKKTIKMVLLGTLFLFIVVYSLARSKDLIFGVEIEDVNIVDGSKTDKSVLEVTGKAKNALKLTLNGREISIDQQGNFFESVGLLSGYNIITIRAEDKFGNVDEENYQLIYSTETE